MKKEWVTYSNRKYLSCYKDCIKSIGFFLTFATLLGGLYILATVLLKTNQKSWDTNSTNYSNYTEPYVSYSIANEDLLGVRWHRRMDKHIISSPFIKYNTSQNVFVVQENSILKITVSLTVDTMKIIQEKSNIICLVYSDETEICKAGWLRPGSRHILTLEHRIFAVPGFYFTVVISDKSLIDFQDGNSTVNIWQLVYSEQD